MARWELAASLKQLRDEINALHPNRSKASDGTIGDAAHSSRTSDHNPDAAGIVRGMDITHDPANGVDSYALARQLVAKPDARLKYVISNGKIASREKGWAWRAYTGSNPHKHHVHISVMPGKTGESNAPWGISKIAAPTASGPIRVLLKKGATGGDVKTIQRILRITPDGVFGDGTERAVIEFQKAYNLLPDGKVGPATWDVLLARA